MGKEQTMSDAANYVPTGSVPRSPWGPLMHEEPTKEQLASIRMVNYNIPGIDYRSGRDAHPANTKQIAGDHYKGKAVQPWTAMEAWMSPEQFKGFLRGNVVKYIARCDDKGGKEDLLKAQHYLEKLLETYP